LFGDLFWFGVNGVPPATAASVVVISGADHSLRKDPAAVALAVVEFVLRATGGHR